MFYLNDFLSVYFSSHMPPHPAFFCIFTARKQSLRRLCFHRCLSVRLSMRGGLCPEGLCPVGWSLFRGISVQGGGLCPGGGFCPEVRIILECILVNKVFLDFVSAITPSE